MTRTLFIAGVNLDKAWIDLGPNAGGELRGWSRQALALVVAEASERRVELLVVLGGLVDRSTALPDTVEYAVQVLGSFSGRVLVVPGPTDWVDGNDLYALIDWAPNTTVLRASAFVQTDEPGVFASGWTSPASYAPRVNTELAGLVQWLIRPALTEVQADLLSEQGRVVTTGSDGGVWTVPDLVRTPGSSGGWGLLVDLASPDSEGERVHLPDQPGRATTLDVSSLSSSQDFADMLTAVGNKPGPVVLALIGTLAPSLLLPGFGGPELPEAVVLDLSGLRYGVETPEMTDRSTRAEFLRAMEAIRGDDRERHQTTALGLCALDSSTVGA